MKLFIIICIIIAIAISPILLPIMLRHLRDCRHQHREHKRLREKFQDLHPSTRHLSR